MNCIITTSSYTSNEDFSKADLPVDELGELAVDGCQRLIGVQAVDLHHDRLEGIEERTTRFGYSFELGVCDRLVDIK